MQLFWKYRLLLTLFFPSLLLGTTSFFQGLISCFALIWGGIFIVLCLFVLRFLQLGERGHFYLLLMLFGALTYLPYPIFVGESLFFPSFSFWNYFVIVLPLLPISLALEKTGKKISNSIRDFAIILLFFCVAFIIFGFLRDLLNFQEFHFWKGPNGTILIGHLLENTRFATLSNQFFSSPVGGVFIIGLASAIFYGRMRKKYES